MKVGDAKITRAKATSPSPETQREKDRRDTMAVIEAATRIFRISSATDAILRSQHELDMRLYTILRLIAAGSRYPSQLADDMNLPRSLITRALHALASAGLIIRAFDSEDTRRTRLELTAQGQLTYRLATDAIISWMTPRLREISDADKTGFLRAMAVITAD